MADEDPVERRENARVAAESRTRLIALEVSREDRAGLWDQLGFNIRDSAGIERIRMTLAFARDIGIDPTKPDQVDKLRLALRWMTGAYEASVTRNKRVMGWVVTVVSTTVGLLGIVKFYLDWRK